tara:strand:+ start:1298 stop:2089 length:792 start_codon:yes stop_codon:yes gene_type:complete
MALQKSLSRLMTARAPANTSPRLPETAQVLILDDQRFDRHRLARLCSGLEMTCTITNANTLAEFARVIESAQFDLVLADYRLPDGTGLDALSMVRLSPFNCNAATIMVSGQGQESVAHDALKAGCSDYITKDELSATTFRRAVTNALQKSVLTTAVQTQTSRSSETQAVLERFASECAQDIKPMVSRMMRQLRDLRSSGAEADSRMKTQFEGVEESCMLLWEFLVDLEGFQASDNDMPNDPTPAGASSVAVRKPPSPFARLSI